MTNAFKKRILALLTCAFVVASCLFGLSFVNANKTFALTSTEVSVSGAIYGDGWLALNLQDANGSAISYTNTGAAADFNGTANVGDHVWFSADGETWVAKCNAGIGSENYIRTYYTGGQLNVNVSKAFATEGYKWIKVMSGTIVPADSAFDGEDAYYTTTEEVILKTSATSIADRTEYSVYVAPASTEVSVSGAIYGDGWLALNLQDANGLAISYTNTGAAADFNGTANVGDHVWFSADGTTWVAKCNAGVGSENYIRTYYTGGQLNVNVSKAFATAEYKWIKVMSGTVLPADSAFDGKESYYTTTEEVILKTSATSIADRTVYSVYEEPTITNANVSVTEAIYGDTWLTLKLQDSSGNAISYTKTGAAADFNNGTVNVGDHVWFSADGETWVAKCNAGIPSENYIRTYWTEGCLNAKVGSGVADNGYKWIKIMSGTVLPADSAFDGKEAYYTTTEEVILKTSAESIVNGTVYSVYVAPDVTDITITEASYGDGWLGFSINGATYSEGIVTIGNYANSNVGDHVLFSADGETWVNKNTILANEYFAKNYSLKGGINIGGLTSDNGFSVSAYPWVKVLSGTLFPADEAFADNSVNKCLKVTEEVILYAANGGSTYSVYVKTGSFKKSSINVGINLDINFYATVSDANLTNVYFTATFGDKTQTFDATSDKVTVNGDLYKLTYTDIAPQNIRKAVTVKLFVEGEQVDEVSYSVWDYCISAINDNSDAKLVSLCKSILAYGGAAQDYLGSDGDDVDIDESGNSVNSDIAFNEADVDNALSMVTEEGAQTELYRFRAAGVRFDNANAVYFRYYVKNGSSAKIYINGSDYTQSATLYKTEANGKIYSVYVSDVSPLGFGEVYTAQLFGLDEVDSSDDSQTVEETYSLIQTLSYSVNSFIYSKYNDQTVGSLAKSLYRYATASKNYFYDVDSVLVYDNSSYTTPSAATYHTITSTGELNLAIGTDNYITMTFNTKDTENHVPVVGTIYYKAVGSKTVYSESFYVGEDEKSISMFLDVYRNGAIASAIKSSDKVIVKVEFNNVSTSQNDGYFTLATIGHSNRMLFAEADSDHVIYMKDGDVTIGFDLDLGGAITYLSNDNVKEYEIYTKKTWYGKYTGAKRYIGTDPTKSPYYVSSYGTNGYKLVKSSGVNLVNIHDTGREIQQSYYAGVAKTNESVNYYNAATGTTQAFGVRDWQQSGSVMQYNPVQAGGVENYESQIVDYSLSKDDNGVITKVYIKTRALEWGTPDDYENVLSWSYMENCYTFKNGMIYVDNCFIDWKGFESIYDNLDGAIGQEAPAIYVASSLGTFYAETATYGTIKDSKFGDMTTTTATSAGTSGGNYHYVIKNDTAMTWHAWLNNEDFGVGFYMPAGEGTTVYYSAAMGGGNAASSLDTGDNSGDGSNCYDNAYCYSSCGLVADFKEQTALEYTYVICVDGLSSIKSNFEGITDVNNDASSAWTPRG